MHLGWEDTHAHKYVQIIQLILHTASRRNTSARHGDGLDPACTRGTYLLQRRGTACRCW